MILESKFDYLSVVSVVVPGRCLTGTYVRNTYNSSLRARRRARGSFVDRGFRLGFGYSWREMKICSSRLTSVGVDCVPSLLGTFGRSTLIVLFRIGDSLLLDVDWRCSQICRGLDEQNRRILEGISISFLQRHRLRVLYFLGGLSFENEISSTFSSRVNASYFFLVGRSLHFFGHIGLRSVSSPPIPSLSVVRHADAKFENKHLRLKFTTAWTFGFRS